MFRWLRKASQQARESTKESANDTARVEADFDFKRRALGVNDELKNVPGVTTPMLAAFGESGIKTIDDLAGCATDDLVGWTEIETPAALRHAGSSSLTSRGAWSGWKPVRQRIIGAASYRRSATA